MIKTMREQMSLFEDPPDESPHALALAEMHRDARALADELPAELSMGTSSWSFPGWAGIVYSAERSTTELARTGLREYARHPLLRTVGIDRSYYAPLPINDLQAYASQLPDGFRCCIKAPASVTAFAIGAPGPSPSLNPDFLSVDRLIDDLLEPLATAFARHTGPIILEFPPFPRGRRLEPAAFLARCHRFLAALPRDFEYAVELRDRSLLTAEYRRMLRVLDIAHTYNYWSAMPTLAEQERLLAVDSAPFVVTRLLLKPGTWYEDQREAFRPFNRLIAPDAAMRDDVIGLCSRALLRKKRVFLLVNNKAEGSSPLTILALARALARRKRQE